MSTATCQGCKKITNSATSDYWFTTDFIPTKCYIAWENNIAIPGCAFNKLTPGAQFLWQETIDKWNINSKKTNEEHLEDIKNYDKKFKRKKRREELEPEDLEDAKLC
jgi:hypothetical protein